MGETQFAEQGAVAEQTPVTAAEIATERSIALEGMTRLFYEDRKDEAYRAAQKVIDEYRLTMTPDAFIRSVVDTGSARISGGDPVRCQTEGEVLSFLKYFKREMANYPKQPYLQQ